MISLAELRVSLTGAFRLLRWQPQGLRFIDTSPAGALRSFWLLLYQLPVVAYLDWSFLRGSLALVQDGRIEGIYMLLSWLVTYGFGWAIGVWYAMLVMRLAVAPALRRAALAAVLAVSNWLGAAYMLAITLLLVLAPAIGWDSVGLLGMLLFVYLSCVMGFAFHRIFNGNLKLAVILAMGNAALSLYAAQQNAELVAFLKHLG